MSEIVIEQEDDPVPIVKIIAAQLRRSLYHPKFVRLARGFKGTFALASTTDPQSVTISADRGKLRVTHGISKDASIIVRLDFNNPDTAPTVEGLWRHPFLAMSVGKLMDTWETTWTDTAGRFWERARAFPRMPRAIRLRCTDDGEELVLGEGEPEVRLEGTAKQLIDMLGGGNVFVLAVMEGKIKVDGSLEHLTILSEVTKNMMLGEL